MICHFSVEHFMDSIMSHVKNKFDQWYCWYSAILRSCLCSQKGCFWAVLMITVGHHEMREIISFQCSNLVKKMAPVCEIKNSPNYLLILLKRKLLWLAFNPFTFLFLFLNRFLMKKQKIVWFANQLFPSFKGPTIWRWQHINPIWFLQCFFSLLRILYSKN